MPSLQLVENVEAFHLNKGGEVNGKLQVQQTTKISLCSENRVRERKIAFERQRRRVQQRAVQQTTIIMTITACLSGGRKEEIQP